MLHRLAASLDHFSTVLPLVVRPKDGAYEVVGGNQRLRLYQAQRVAAAPCVMLELDDTQACLLAQVLNRVHGEDAPERKIALLRQLLEALPSEEVARFLPDSEQVLRGFASLGELSAESLGEQVAAWSRLQEAKAAARLAVTSFSLAARVG